MSNAIKILLVDDHAAVRAGFHMLLSIAGNAERGQAGYRAQALVEFRKPQPD